MSYGCDGPMADKKHPMSHTTHQNKNNIQNALVMNIFHKIWCDYKSSLKYVYSARIEYINRVNGKCFNHTANALFWFPIHGYSLFVRPCWYVV